MTITTTEGSDRRIGRESTEAPRQSKRESDMPDPLPMWYLKKRQEYEGRIHQLEIELQEIKMTLVQADNAAREQRDEDIRSLALYGGERTLVNLTQQVAVSPKFVGLAPAHHEYVARVALATGLNPEFHIHAWISKKYNPQTQRKEDVLNVTPDYKGLLARTARDRYMIKQRRLTPDEMRERGIPEQDISEGAIGYLVEAWDLAMKVRCDQAGVEYEPIRGYGWWAARKAEERWDEQKKRMVPTGQRVPNDVSNTRDGAFEAWRRATRALCYQIADLSIKFGGGIDVPGAQIVDNDTYQFAPPAPSAAVSETPAVLEGEFTDMDDFEMPPHAAESSARADVVPDPTPAPAPEVKAAAPETGHKPDSSPRKCRNCGIDDADPLNLVDGTLCTRCANAEADRQAAKK